LQLYGAVGKLLCNADNGDYDAGECLFGLARRSSIVNMCAAVVFFLPHLFTGTPLIEYWCRPLGDLQQSEIFNSAYQLKYSLAEQYELHRSAAHAMCKRDVKETVSHAAHSRDPNKK
jgi:hypothetical protein